MAARTTCAKSTAGHIQPHLAGNDAAHIEQVFDELRLGFGVSLDDRQAFVLLAVVFRAEHELGVAQDRVERRSQFVRNGREKLVFEPVGPLGLAACFALAGEQVGQFSFAFAKCRLDSSALVDFAAKFGVQLRQPRKVKRLGHDGHERDDRRPRDDRRRKFHQPGEAVDGVPENDGFEQVPETARTNEQRE